MKLITLDIALTSVFQDGFFFGRVKKEVYDISPLSHGNDNDFNRMRLFDRMRFLVHKETYLSNLEQIRRFENEY